MNAQRLSKAMAAGSLRRAGAPRRGSTILLVITILSLLALLAITMTYTSRLEISASDNFATGVQNRVAAITGVEAMGTQLFLTLPPGPTSPLDFTLNRDFLRLRPGSEANVNAVSRLFELSPNREMRRTQIADERIARRSDFQTPQTGTANVAVFDAAARVNVNAADEVVLAGLFDAVAERSGLPARGASIARAIAQVRLGPDGAPGQAGVDDNYNARHAVQTDSDEIPRGLGRRPDAQEGLSRMRDLGARDAADRQVRRRTRQQLVTGIDEPDEYIADIRLPAFGDDVRFGSLRDLLTYEPIVRAGLDEALLRAAAPHLTLLSTSVEERIVGAEAKPLIDINRATAQQIYDGLVELYGEGNKNEILLRQFAVNIVDARDFNSVPTVLRTDQGIEVIGLERTPFLTEVYPDSLTPDEEGDDGQFVEIHNPWDEDIDVTGWVLRGPGGTYPLRGLIAARGFLIVTDDVDNSLDDDDKHVAGTGSLYDIFGVLPDNYRRRAIHVPHFSIPTSGGPHRFALEDGSGNLIDVFRFTVDPRDKDSLVSWQRESPMVRHAVRRRATPFGVPPLSAAPDSGVLARLQASPPNGPFVDAVDLFDVFAGFADEQARLSNPWGFPEAISPRSATVADADRAGRPEVIDARILDLFTVNFRPMKERGGSGDELEGSTGPALASVDLPAEILTVSYRAEPKELQAFVANNYFTPSASVRHGRINLNTAGEVALASLPTVSKAAAGRLIERRREMISQAWTGMFEDAITYHGLSDVLVDDLLWASAQSPKDRLEQFRQLLPHVALNTRAFVLVGQPRAEAGADADFQRAAGVEALVTIDRGSAETVYWRRMYE